MRHLVDMLLSWCRGGACKVIPARREVADVADQNLQAVSSPVPTQDGVDGEGAQGEA